jgi:hypothetical protein
MYGFIKQQQQTQRKKYMSECNTSECCTQEHEQEACCPIENAVQQGNCPVDAMVDGWKCSFGQAMKEAQVDILKEKIKKNWGPMLDKQADAVITAMGSHFQTIIARAKAQCDLKESIKSTLKS